MPQLRLRVIADKMPLPDTKRQLPKFRVWEESCRPGLGEQGELGPTGKRVMGSFTNTYHYRGSELLTPGILVMAQRKPFF